MFSTDQLNHQLDVLPTTIGWPTVTRVSQLDAEATLELEVPAELPVFAGHFPDQPVLPGIVQVHWAAQLAQLIFGQEDTDFSRMRGIKFNAMVLPNQAVTLTLSLTDRGLRFSFVGDDAKYSNGTLAVGGSS